jgi:hypothetical protein
MLGRGVVPGQCTDAGKQEDDARDRPQESCRRRAVADQRLMRPVLGIADVLAGTAGHRRPRRPEEERRHRRTMAGVRNRVLVNRVLVAQRAQRRRVAEQLAVMRGDLGDHRSAVVRHGQHAAGRVVGIGAHLVAQSRLQRGLALRRLRVMGDAVLGLRPAIEQTDRLAVQPVRRPVRCDIAAVAPDRAELLAADALPDLAAAVVVGARVQQLAGGAAHRVGNRRLREVDLAPHPAKHGEGREHNHAERDP